MQVGDGVVLPVAEPPDEGVDVLGVRLLDVLHDVGLNVVGLLHYLLLDGLEELFGLHQQRALDPYVLLDITFGELVHGKGTHSHPNHLVPIRTDAVHQVRVAVVQVVLSHVVVHQSPDVVAGQSAVHVADEQFVIVCVEVDLGGEREALNAIVDYVLAEGQVEELEFVGGEG